MKRVIAVLLVCMLVLPLCMVTAFAADTGYTFEFLSDLTDKWNVVGDNIPDGKYMVEYWTENTLYAYSSPFEYKKDNCISRWDVGLAFYAPIAMNTIGENLGILYVPADESLGDKMFVTVPDPFGIPANLRPTFEIRFVPITDETPMRLFFGGIVDDSLLFTLYEPLESGVYSFVVRETLLGACYRTEPFVISFSPHPVEPNEQIATVETYMIVEDDYIAEPLKVPLSIEILKIGASQFIGIRCDIIPEGATYAEVERVALADGKNDSVVNQLSTVANSFFDTIGRIAEKIVSEPLLLLTVGIFFIGGCIAIFARFLRRE